MSVCLTQKQHCGCVQPHTAGNILFTLGLRVGGSFQTKDSVAFFVCVITGKKEGAKEGDSEDSRKATAEERGAILGFVHQEN